jgi:hypothetical protein
MMRYEKITIKRDTQTTHNKSVPPWEVPVIEFIFDGGNVTRLGGFDTVDREYPDPRAEYERLNTVYGSDPETKTPIVAEVFGQAGAGIRELKKLIDAAKAEDEEVVKAHKPRASAKSRAARIAEIAADPLCS